MNYVLRHINSQSTSFTSISSTGSVYRPSEISLFRRARRLSRISRSSAAVTSTLTFFLRPNICKPSFRPHSLIAEKDLQMCGRYVSDLPQQVTGARQISCFPVAAKRRGKRLKCRNHLNRLRRVQMITCSKPPPYRRRRCGRSLPPSQRSKPSGFSPYRRRC